MKTLIDRDELYKALAQWDWQDLYLPVHFKELVDELPAQRSYEDGVRKGYEDAVQHYAKLALKQWISTSERLPKINGQYLVTKTDHITNERLIDIAFFADWYQNNNGFYKADRVIAWMPLSAPYEVEDD